MSTICPGQAELMRNNPHDKYMRVSVGVYYDGQASFFNDDHFYLHEFPLEPWGEEARIGLETFLKNYMILLDKNKQIAKVSYLCREGYPLSREQVEHYKRIHRFIDGSGSLPLPVPGATPTPPPSEVPPAPDPQQPAPAPAPEQPAPAPTPEQPTPTPDVPAPAEPVAEPAPPTPIQSTGVPGVVTEHVESIQKRIRESLDKPNKVV